MLDSCDYERESDEYDESEIDERSLLGDMEADTSTITLHDVSDVDMTDQSECEVVAQVPVEPEIVVIRASKPVCKMLTDEAQVLKNTPAAKMSSFPPPCKIAKSAPETEKEKRKVVVFQSTPRNLKSVKTFPSSVPGISKTKPSTVTRPTPPPPLAPTVPAPHPHKPLLL